MIPVSNRPPWEPDTGLRWDAFIDTSARAEGQPGGPLTP